MYAFNILRTTTKEPFTFYIFTMDVSHIKSSYIAISEEKTEYLDSIAKSYNKDSKVVRMDVIEIITEYLRIARMSLHIVLRTHF